MQVLGLGEVLEVLAVCDEGFVVEVLCRAEVVEVVWVRQSLHELLAISNTALTLTLHDQHTSSSSSNLVAPPYHSVLSFPALPFTRGGA